MLLGKAKAATGAVGVLAVGFVAVIVLGTYAASGAPAAAGNQLALSSRSVPAAYQAPIEQWGALCPELSPPLLAAQLYQESGFKPTAKSPVGAQGMAQFMPDTWAKLRPGRQRRRQGRPVGPAGRDRLRRHLRLRARQVRRQGPRRPAVEHAGRLQRQAPTRSPGTRASRRTRRPRATYGASSPWPRASPRPSRAARSPCPPSPPGRSTTPSAPSAPRTSGAATDGPRRTAGSTAPG